MSRSTIIRLAVASLLILFFAAASIFFMKGRHTAYADASPQGGRASDAIGSQGFRCFIQLPPQIPYVETTDSHEAQSNGNDNLVCHFVADPPPQTVILTGWLCSTSDGTTTDSRAIYAQSGDIIIICNYPGS